MSRWQNWVTAAVVGAYFASMWAALMVFGPKYDKENQEEKQREADEDAMKNERYIRMLKIRVALQDARKDEIKLILEERPLRDAAKNATMTE